MFRIDSNPRRLECCALQWHGEDESLGGIVLRGAHDFWKLRAIQFARCHFS